MPKPAPELEVDQLLILYPSCTLCGQYMNPSSGVTDREEFFRWATNLPAGKSYFASAFNIPQTTERIPNLLCCFLAKSAQEKPDALNDLAAMFDTWKTLYNWLMPKMVSRLSKETLVDAATIDLSSLAMTGSCEGSAPMESSEGYRAILIPEQLHFVDVITRTTLHWQDEFGRGHKFQGFTFPAGVVPEDPNDERYLVFTAGGIDSRDASGNTLGLEDDA